ncbi:hypothetical protein NA57DRAFT_40469 [Rhizodiscina lignyota]|uniref:Major royal jelly protein n=1 Tax=Rhizodiscina lignyota TaxID=1504668 RepID=A0A9P4M5X8_9PEZI|nr:hypothetical protein NA57DRAFT_40469 [Rhizodiscina lignyota]
MSRFLAVALAALLQLCTSQSLTTDPGVYGPELEIAHLYYDEWPTGIAVSSTGRMFSNYPPGLDAANLNDGKNGKYTVAELVSNTTERPYPSAEWNNPPGGSINYTTNPPSGANYPNYLIGVQSVVVDPADRLWILDTGRALLPDSSALVPSSPGGPKLIGVDLHDNKIFKTILFPPTVAYADSYLNDIRFDLRSSLTSSGKGIGYITDSSTEGRNGLIVVDLGSGESWRYLDTNPTVRPEGQFLAFLWGTSLYSLPSPNASLAHINFGSDGIALGADGEDLYWGAVGSRYMYSIPTSALRAHGGPTDEIMAQSAVRNRGQKGVSDGFETDSNGRIYVGNFEQNAVNFYDPKNGTVETFVRDPRLNWIDTMSVATDGYLYFTNNQLAFSAAYWPGTDRRKKPYTLFRAKLPEGGTKVTQSS